MNRYAVLRRKQEQEIHALPIGFAFGNRQFEELMRHWGFDPEKDLDKIYQLGDTGGFYKRTDAQLIRDTFHKYEEELQAAIDADPTGEGFIKDMFLCELENHEYSYTGTSEDALEALGLSYEDVAANPKLIHGLELAEKECQLLQDGMWM